MCQKWFAKFCAGDFLLDDAPQLGRPAEVDKDQIETLTENNQHYTTWEIADILKISKSVKLLVKMKNVPFILWNKPYRLSGQSSIFLYYKPRLWAFNFQSYSSTSTIFKNFLLCSLDFVGTSQN